MHFLKGFPWIRWDNNDIIKVSAPQAKILENNKTPEAIFSIWKLEIRSEIVCFQWKCVRTSVKRAQNSYVLRKISYVFRLGQIWKRTKCEKFVRFPIFGILKTYEFVRQKDEKNTDRYRFDWGTVPLLFRILFGQIWGKCYGYCFVSGNLGARPKV